MSIPRLLHARSALTTVPLRRASYAPIRLLSTPIQSSQGPQGGQGAKKNGSRGVLVGTGLALAAAAATATYFSTRSDVNPALAKADKALGRVSKTHDYQKIYNEIADVLEEEGYDDGSLGPVRPFLF